MMVLTVSTEIGIDDFEEQCSASYSPVTCELLSSTEVLLRGTESQLYDLQYECLLSQFYDSQFCPVCDRARDCSDNGEPSTNEPPCTCECDSRWILDDCSAPEPTPADFVDPPNMVYANFDNTGLFLTIEFDTATDKGGLSGVFPCSELFSSTFVESFGAYVDGVETSSCYWSSVHSLVVSLGKAPAVVPDSWLTILPTIKVYDGNSFEASGVVQVEAMDVIGEPIAVISGPTRVDMCAVVILSGTLS